MERADRTTIEASVRAAWDRRDYDAAATLIVREYGPELFGFLVATSHDKDDASEAFSLFSEDLWRGLPRFEWRASLRTWLYAIARNAAWRLLRDEARRRRRGVRVGSSALDAVVAQVRTATLDFLKTEARGRLEKLRDELEPDDRALLILRVDRGLSWNELASVLSPDEDVTRESARLRKRFQLLKDRLKKRAREEGLVE